MTQLTFLHTSEVHIKTFDALLARRDNVPNVRHLVHTELLAAAQVAQGVTPTLTAELNGILRKAAVDSDVILCTCSTLGAAAERFSEANVVRIDRPMAARAAQLGGRVVVLAALEATLASTETLLQEEMAKVAHPAKLRLELCAGAWEQFEVGKLEAYHKRIAACLENLAPNADVLVLAQASMMGALEFTTTDKPVLSSPELGLVAALELLP